MNEFVGKKVLLIDGYSILNRAFYGVPMLTNAEGLHTNAVYGFINIMLKVMDTEKPDALICAWDVSRPTFRHLKYAEYKGTRKPMPQELKEQVPLIQEMLRAMNIPACCLEGYEADDIIGTLAKYYQSIGNEAVILSGDRDLLQLADHHIRISLPRTSMGMTTVTDYTPQKVMEEFGVTPEEFIDLKALMGDTSDNIPGLPGVGEKTAKAIITAYHSIENAHEHAAELKPPRASKAMIEHYDSAVLSKWLATIDTKVPLHIRPEEALVGNIFTAEAKALAVRLNFKSLLKRFKDSEEKKDAAGDVSDTEKDFRKEADDHKPQNADEREYQDTEYAVIDGCVYAADLKKLLSSGKADEKLQESNHVYDIGIARYLLDPLNRPETSFRENEVSHLMERLKEEGMYRLYTEIEMPLVYSLAAMEKAGIRVEKEKLHAYGEELKGDIDRIESDIIWDAGEQFNINSPKQLGTILFEKMGLPGSKKTKTGWSTSADVLEKLADDYPFVKKILNYRQLSKLYSTYALGLDNYIGEDGRIHGRFNQTVTATGRISSTEPNLQNIPVRTEMGSRFRGVFVPEDGYVFVDADYSQIELRVLAAMSGDEALMAAYRNAVDIHSLTASQVFHVPLDQVTPQQRRNAKAVNFGVVYGISAFGLSEDLSISRAEAQEYINNYFKTYPQVKAYLDASIKKAKEEGYVTTLFGRKRPVPEIRAANYMQRQFGERIAMNSPIQGTAADIMKIAMNSVRKNLLAGGYDARIVLQVHDELLIEVRKDQAEEVKDLAVKLLKGAADIGVSLEVDAHIGDSWLEAK